MFRDLFTNTNPQRTKNILSALLLFASISIGLAMIANYAFSEYAFNTSDAPTPQPVEAPNENQNIAPATEVATGHTNDDANTEINAVETDRDLSTPEPEPQITQQPVETTTSNPDPPPAEANINDTVEAQLIAPTETAEENVKKITVTVQVQGPGVNGNYDAQVEAGSTAYQAMKAAKNNGLIFTTGTFPGLGVYISGVNGVNEDAKAGLYWIYYVNGVKAKTGVSNYKLKNGDIIKWVLEPDINR